MERTPPSLDGPDQRNGYPVWSAEWGSVRVRFVGRGNEPRPDRESVLAAVEGRPIPVAGLRQVHSDRVLGVAEAGDAGEGDAVWTERAGLALSVVTADCVPVVVAADPGPGHGWRIAAVHAGWRGIVAGVVPRALEALDVPPPRIRAWIGPAIGSCCYEVGDAVAAEIAAAVGAEWVLPPLAGSRDRAHVDLAGAVRHQLASAGAPAARLLPRCTRCDGARLWSYRREGKAAGRNHAYVWLEAGRPAGERGTPCG